MQNAAMNLDAYAPRNPDEDYNALDDEAEQIYLDADRLHDAVCSDDGASAYDLAQLRIVLADAHWLIGELAKGVSLDDAIANKSRQRTASTFATLARNAEACSELVDSRVMQAAADAIDA